MTDTGDSSTLSPPDFIARLRKQAVCVYIATDKTVADDLAASLNRAAADLERINRAPPERDAIISECARQVPTTWLDPLLSGPEAVAQFEDCRAVERLLSAVAERIRAMTSREDCDCDGGEGEDCALMEAEFEIERLRAILSWLGDHEPVLVDAAVERFGTWR